MTKHILGIETSCDDTCVAIMNCKKDILCNLIQNQDQYHKPYKGVVPEIAARAHSEKLYELVNKASKILPLSKLDAVCATTRPGLIGGLITGTVFAKTLSVILKIPFFAIDHLLAHVLAIQINNPSITYPYLSLLISGGHCQFIAVISLTKQIIIGSTIDDALGETFDKVARMLNFDYPGGPMIEKAAKDGKENTYSFPKPLLKSDCANFSFSGLKTHLKIFISNLENITQQQKANICASFQKTISDILIYKSIKAINVFNRITQQEGINMQKSSFVLAGGVASNLYIRAKIQKAIEEQNNNFKFLVPNQELCTDNAAMIANVGIEYIKHNITTHNDIPTAKSFNS